MHTCQRREQEDDESRVRQCLSAAREALFRLLSAHHMALSALQYQWVRHDVLSSSTTNKDAVLRAYEQASVTKALYWTGTCVACVATLLEELLDVPVQQAREAAHQRARCRLWFRVLAGWCHCTTL